MQSAGASSVSAPPSKSDADSVLKEVAIHLAEVAGLHQKLDRFADVGGGEGVLGSRRPLQRSPTLQLRLPLYAGQLSLLRSCKIPGP